MPTPTITYDYKFNVVQYGATGDGTTDDTSFIKLAISAAITADKENAVLYFPSTAASYRFTAPLTLTDSTTKKSVGILGDGVGSTLKADFATPGPAIGIGDASYNGSNPRLENFFLTTPKDTTQFGPKDLQTITLPYGFTNTIGDGIVIQGTAQPLLRDVLINNFDRGIVYSNTTGHIYLDHCGVTNNFYGIYVQNTAGDYFIRDSQINSNLFANIGVPGNTGLNGMAIYDTHIGFAPYGIYQEPFDIAHSAGRGISGCVFNDAHFELIGNGAVVAANQFTTILDTRVSDSLNFFNVGFIG